MPRQKTITTYSINELESTAREVALGTMREWSVDVLDDHLAAADGALAEFRNILSILGFYPLYHTHSGKRDIGIHYSVGSCDDYLTFEARWDYKPGSYRAIVNEYPTETALRSIAASLQHAAKRCLWDVYADVTETRANVMVGVDRSEGYAALPAGAEDDIREAIRDLCDWGESRLRDEYEYQTSDEYLIEIAEANECRFDDEGRIV